MIGSREGSIPGSQQTREETLRLNISGRAADTDIEASLYRTSALGSTRLSENDDQISILMRRGSTEAYLGDFDASLTETEFGALNKRLSGGRIKTVQNNWGLVALYSSPKENIFAPMAIIQGPYTLSHVRRLSPVVG